MYKFLTQRTIFIASLLCFPFCSTRGDPQEVNPSETHLSSPQQFIRQVFTDVVENMAANEETYSTYFSEKYIQHVDGKTLGYKEFVDHMKAQKAAMKSVEVSFEHIVAEGDKICTVHSVNGVKKNGEKIGFKIIALFQIKEGKIIFCDELTHLTMGTRADKDLGSRIHSEEEKIHISDSNLK